MISLPIFGFIMLLLVCIIISYVAGIATVLRSLQRKTEAHAGHKMDLSGGTADEVVDPEGQV